MKKPRLVAITGSWAETIWYIRNGRLTVGRSAENDVCLDDPTVSGLHALFEMLGDQMWVRDRGSENGIAVNDIGYLDRAIFHGDIIELGITKVVYLEHDDDAEALPVIIRDEVDRSREFSTLRFDKTPRDEQAIHQRSVRRVMTELARMLPTLPEPGAFQSRAIELAFRVIHARRAVIMSNRRRIASKPEDYSARVWREREVPGESPFDVSGTTLDDVHKTGEALRSNNITPVICVPIKVNRKIEGVFYLEGTAGVPFDQDNLECADAIAAFVASSLALSRLVDILDTDCERLRAKMAPDSRMIGSSPKMKEVFGLPIARSVNHPVCMEDRGKRDDKILAVPTNDPIANDYHDTPDIPQHFLKEVAHFFAVYKDLEGVNVKTIGWQDGQHARQAIQHAIELYNLRSPL